MANDEDRVSEAGALVRLGLKVTLGTRGEYVAEYLDDRRTRRIAARLNAVGESATDAGLTAEDLHRRITEDDDAAELLEAVLDAAKTTRYEPKVRYLGRCLAAALAGDDEAAIDTTWLKIAAVKDLEAVHVRLLHAVKDAQDRRAEASPRLHVDPAYAPPPVGDAALVEDRARRRAGFPAATFHAVMATLVRNGLVATEQGVDVEIDIEIDADFGTAEGAPTATSETLYRLTGVGRELLEEFAAAIAEEDASGPSTTARDSGDQDGA